MNERNYLSHYGVLGMHWGKRRTRKGAPSKVKTVRERPKSKKLYIYSGKKINGKDLSEDILGNIGMMLVSSYGGKMLTSAGFTTAGPIIEKLGPLYYGGAAIGSILNRSEVKEVE